MKYQETEYPKTLKAPTKNTYESTGPNDYDFVDDSLQDDMTTDANMFDDIFTGAEQAQQYGDFAKEVFDDIKADSAAAVDQRANATQTPEVRKTLR